MTLKKSRKIITFLICGIITAAFNILLFTLIIELLELKTPLLRNIANAIAIEISLIFTFFVYKTWVWRNAKWQFKQIICSTANWQRIRCRAYKDAS
jgi:putative flippase GtrA